MTTRGLFPDAQQTFVEGEVTRVTFENGETGFRVVKLAVKGKSERLTVVGTLPPVHVGAELRVRGTMVDDPRHGPQLRAEGATLLQPNTAKGVLRYLSSGVVPGVGEKLAARIVETFGDRAMQVLDEEPERLAGVPGLGKKRAARLAASWRGQKAERDVQVFLQGHGATASLAHRVMKQYGGAALEVVTKDPYRLALEVVGVGFRTADRMAAGLGVARDSPQRLRAGLLQALLDDNETGHVFTLTSVLFERARTLLGETETGALIPLDQLDAALMALAVAGHVVLEGAPTDSTRPVYLPRMHAAERRLAERVRALTASKVKAWDGVAQAVAEFEKGSRVTLADEQRAAVLEASRSPLSIVTGGPGVGKTTVLKAILSVFRRAGVAVKLAAPTGRAAKRMTAATSVEAATLHRLLEFDPQRGGGFRRDARAPIEAGAVIVDEASMIDLPMADTLLQAIGEGSRLVLVGDKDQLPSIGPGAVLRDLIASGAAPCVTLRHIFRQAKESQIVVNAHRIHEGLSPIGSTDPDGDFFVIDKRDAEGAAKVIVELVTSRIPRRFGLDPVRDVQVLTPMHRGPAGSHAINAALQAALNPAGAPLTRGQRVYRMGDKVMQLRNDYERTVWNGDIGVVVAVDSAAGTLDVRFDDDREPRAVKYEGAALDDLTLAYACSVHKAQGSEFSAVVIPLLTSHFVMLTRNLLYTAVTRGKRLVVLVADPRAVELALGEAKRDDRNSQLAERVLHPGRFAFPH